MVQTLERMRHPPPEVTAQDGAKLTEARRALEAEGQDVAWSDGSNVSFQG